ncbi:MAG TPA: 3'(2'),5'-bisphosphate nucleotidase [Leucothrix sp.]|nr:3'(2'),5'-bisphosphate nucleotidase [Leucothrix sp.]
MLNQQQLKKLLPEVHQIAKDAGELIMDVYKNGFDITIKADDSPVTTADLAANAHIETELKKLLPSFPILSEESAPLSFEERMKRETYWLIDPLDGTKEFIKHNDNFTVNIALIHKNKSVLGVVYAPAHEVSYIASKGNGSFKESALEELHKIQVRQIADTTIFACSRSHPGKVLSAFLTTYKEKYGDYALISMGSSLKMCMVAEGSADLYPRLWPTSEWDTAAAHCIVDEAGGQLVKTDMSPLLYNTKDSLLNPYFLTIGENDINWQQFIPDSAKTR